MNFSQFTNFEGLSGWIMTAAEVTLTYALWHERARYLEEKRHIKERVDVNLEVINPQDITQKVFGQNRTMDSIADHIDRLRYPDKYLSVRPGIEILLVGPPKAGKKALALDIARAADVQRAIIVHNPRDENTLAHARKLIENKPSFIRRQWQTLSRKITRPNRDLLLLPGLNDVNGYNGEAWLDQLEALIDTASKKPHVLIIGTTEQYHRTGNVASWFSTVLEFPARGSEQWKNMVHEIAEGFLEIAKQSGYKLKDIEPEKFISLALKQDPTPGEIERIFNHCQSLAISRSDQSPKEKPKLELTAETLNIAIQRVIRPIPSTHLSPAIPSQP